MLAASLMVLENSWIAANSSESFNLHGLSLFSNSALKLAVILSASRCSIAGSTTALSGAIRPNDSRNLLSRSSLAVIISTLTNASRKPMAISAAFSRNASAKFITTCWKLPTVISIPIGAEGRGNSPPKKDDTKTSSKCMKSPSMCESSPAYAGLVTFSPGCGRPKLLMLRNVLARRSTLGLASSGTFSGFRWSSWCSRICPRHSWRENPSSKFAQSRTKISKCPKGASLPGNSLQTVWANVVM
mmetsp:Transcript_85365/g.261057  ORF Transcript_85365/g.261057 Transcript_85365/m.261057 type:complete len:244 (+) Transcript_85365:390-1121(+)